MGVPMEKISRDDRPPPTGKGSEKEGRGEEGRVGEGRGDERRVGRGGVRVGGGRGEQEARGCAYGENLEGGPSTTYGKGV